MPGTPDFKAKLAAYQRQIEQGLQQYVPAADTRPMRLHAAMRYSLEAGGKRLRPMLTLAAATRQGETADALPAAIAIECVHTYSLIHDDLPAMDNDDLRRGRPTCHREFDEATAILAGDALLTHAFALLGEQYASDPMLAAALVRELAQAAGSARLIGGQMEDILGEDRANIEPDELEFIHRNKTAAMIEAALVMGGLCAHARDEELAKLRQVGTHLGLAFQIIDDILDATSTSDALGKTAGKDARAGKATYVRIHGLDVSRTQARAHSEAAIGALRDLPGDTSFLVELAASLLVRTT